MAIYNPQKRDQSGSPWTLVLGSVYDCNYIQEALDSKKESIRPQMCIYILMASPLTKDSALECCLKKDMEHLKQDLTSVLILGGEVKKLSTKEWRRRVKKWLVEKSRR